MESASESEPESMSASVADGIYRLVLSIFYPTFFCSSLIVEGIALVLIFRYTPQNMAILKMILANTHICQLMVMFLSVACQLRMISSRIPIELRSYGLVRYLPAHLGYSLQHLYQFFLYMSGTSIIITFYFKYATMKGSHMSRNLMMKCYLIFHIPVMISGMLEIFMVITQSLPAEVRQMYAELNAHVGEYATIGVLSLQSIPSRVNFVLMSGSVFLYPFVCFFFRNRILKVVNDHMQHVSTLRKNAHRSFVTGLTIQALLPLLCYTPVFSLYVYVIISHEEILLQQYGMYLFTALPAFFDPLITLYFVVPYRLRIMSWLKIEPKPVKTNAHTSNPRISNPRTSNPRISTVSVTLF